MKTTIYCYTGAGNSLKIAKDIQSHLPNTEIILIGMSSLSKSHGADDVVGLVFPIHHFGLPPLVAKFAEKLDIQQETYLFAVADYGGKPGIAFEMLEDILDQKDCFLASAFGVLMPGVRWHSYFPKRVKQISARLEAQPSRTKEIARKIANREMVRDLVFDALPSRKEETAFYGQFHPHNMDRDFWTDSRCDGCGICEKICPSRNIRIESGKPVWLHQCLQCFSCYSWCPLESVQFQNITEGKERYHHPSVYAEELFGR